MAFFTTSSISVAVGIAIGAASLYVAPFVGLRAVESRLAKCYATGETVSESRDASEGLRSSENAVSVDAVSDERLTCDARLREANRQCDARLARRQMECRYDENNCPERAVLPLRGLLGPDVDDTGERPDSAAER